MSVAVAPTLFAQEVVEVQAVERSVSIEERVLKLRGHWPNKVTKQSCIDPFPDEGVSDRTTGAYYLWSKRVALNVVRHLSTSVLCEESASSLQQELLPGEIVLGVPRYFRHQGEDDGDIELAALLRGAVWFIDNGGVKRIRGGHQRRSTTYYRRPEEPNYRVQGTDLQFPFIEPNEAHKALGISEDQWAEQVSLMRSRGMLLV